MTPHSWCELLGHAEDKEGKEEDNKFSYRGLLSLDVYFTFVSLHT